MRVRARSRYERQRAKPGTRKCRTEKTPPCFYPCRDQYAGERPFALLASGRSPGPFALGWRNPECRSGLPGLREAGSAMSSQRRCLGCGRRVKGRGRYCDGGCARDHARKRAVELAEEVRATFDPTTIGLPLVAQHSGTCPVCGGFIRAGRSRIVALATPTYSLVPELDRDGHPKRRRLRTWVHERHATDPYPADLTEARP